MSDRQRSLRIFISSPSDVRPERLKAEQIVARLGREFEYRFRVEVVLWEHEPLLAAHHFQDPKNIPRPRGMDVVVVILWSRLGVLLPEDQFRGAISGLPVTGTEWEFEDALAGVRERGVPDLLLYRKTAEPISGLGDRSAVQLRLAQLDGVDEFFARWFRGADDRSFTAASHSFAATDEFEKQLYDHLRALLERRAGTPTVGIAIHWHDAPFRGLLSFDYEHAPVFFGRTRARNELRELLARRETRGRAFILVLGASGSGKSSLVKAGLLPDLMLPGMIGRIALVRRALLRPSDAPMDLVGALASALLGDTALPELARLHYSQPQLAALLRDAPALAPIRQGLGAAMESTQLAGHAEARVAIVVDQLEELFTIDGVDAADRDAFVTALDVLARSGLIWVIATMRSDFYGRLEQIPSLADDEACYHLLPPDDAELGQIIRRPPREAGLRFAVDSRTGVSLDDVILRAAARDRGALPLLSFLLDQLWRHRTVHGELTFAAYEDLGGLEGALGRRAEEIYLAQPALVQAALPEVLRALVTVERGTEAIVTSRPAALDRFAEGSAGQRLTAALLAPDARLLVADAEAGASRIRVAHEALLEHWPRAKRQISEDLSDLRLRARLEDAQAQWEAASAADRNSLLLAPGLPQSEAEDFLARREAELDPAIAGYIRESGLSARRRQRREMLRLRIAAAILSALVVAATAGAWYGISGRERAERQTALAEKASEIAATREQEAGVQRARAEGQFIKANNSYFKFLASALGQEPDPHRVEAVLLSVLPRDFPVHDAEVVPPELSWRLPQALAQDRQRLVLQEGFRLAEARFSPDGRSIVTAGPRLIFWDAVTGRKQQELSGEPDYVNHIVFSPDGFKFLTDSNGKAARLWDSRTRKLLKEFPHDGMVTSSTFSADGARVLTTSNDKTAAIWDVATGERLLTLNGHPDAVYGGVFSPDGSKVATMCALTVHIWDANTGAELANMKATSRRIAFSPDGTELVTAGYGVTFWSVRAGEVGRQLLEFKAHPSDVLAVSFSADGARLLTASYDRTAQIWDARNGAHLLTFEGHTAPIATAEFSPDGSLVVTGSEDGTARLWDAATGAQIALVRHGANITSAHFNADGSRIVTASGDLNLNDVMHPTHNAARIWTTEPTGEIHVLRHRKQVFDARFRADGNEIITASYEEGVGRWSTASGTRLATLVADELLPSVMESAIFSPDGSRIAATTYGSALLWDASTSAVIKEWKAVTKPSFYQVKSVAFNPDSTRVATGWTDGSLRISNAIDGSELVARKFGQAPAHDGAINSVAFSGDGTKIVTASADQTVRIWDASTGALLNIVNEGKKIGSVGGPVYMAVFSPDSTRVLSAGASGGQLWDAANGKLLARFQLGAFAYAAAFNLMGTLIATADADHQAAIWRPDGTLLQVLKHGDDVKSVAFSPDGSLIVTASADRTARVWDVRSGTQLMLLKGHQGEVYDAVFSPDGSLILTSSEDGTARVWRVPLVRRTEVEFARAISVDQLDLETRQHFVLPEDENPGTDVRTNCDRLAADPVDPGHKGIGAAMSRPPPPIPKIIETCRADIAAQPAETRLRVELGAMLHATGSKDEARALFDQAMAEGYAAAFYVEAGLYYVGDGVAKDPVRAKQLAEDAEVRGVPWAAFFLGTMYWDGAEGIKQDREAALAAWRRGARNGDPFSLQRLAELAEQSGDAVSLRRAFSLHALAARLFAEDGFRYQAQEQRNRRAALAYLLPIEEVSDIMKVSETWTRGEPMTADE